MNDVQLLEQFVGEKDEASFVAIVGRHGPRVRRVCRAVLSNHHDADDAFQATFMVLLRKATLIRDPQGLGNWLHGVAHRIATRHRRDLARRREYERDRVETGSPPSEESRPWDDMGRTVREELNRLPDTFRIPLELCYLRGRTHEQAANELGWPLGTLKTRINRGKKRLQDRLDRRGITVGVGLILLLLSKRTALAAPKNLTISPGSSGATPVSEKIPDTPTKAPSRLTRRVLTPYALALTKPHWPVIALIVLSSILAACQVFAFFAEAIPGCG